MCSMEKHTAVALAVLLLDLQAALQGGAALLEELDLPDSRQTLAHLASS